MSVRNLPELQGLLSARLFQDRFNPYHMQSAKIGVTSYSREERKPLAAAAGSFKNRKRPEIFQILPLQNFLERSSICEYILNSRIV